MDGIGLSHVIPIVSNFGIPGLVLLLWYLSDRAFQKALTQYREEALATRKQYESDIGEIRAMYEKNVDLVKGYAGVCKDLKDIVVLNTQAWQRTSDDINRNQFCPMVRLRKEAEGRQG